MLLLLILLLLLLYFLPLVVFYLSLVLLNVLVFLVCTAFDGREASVMFGCSRVGAIIVNGSDAFIVYTVSLPLLMTVLPYCY